ncbi:asparagine synthase-domain-containing protein [Suillus subalutaceus]|uniref:asparagine synthase-domain-containing protein n=1 Tax=Suillus subalutaceus TaxID=48586 RepID=UPI001B8719DB|nr:asparagine synthase-domain-containing protein [Suillus subalutaceus]KAG1867838.1 asparagine synthase-domain-containing protein [Suillus subalutaceus]
MCGIFCSLHVGCCGDTDNIHGGPNNAVYHELSERLKVANAARGPDAQGTHHVRVQGTWSGEAQAPSPSKTCGLAALDLEFFASELRLRGDEPIVQPHQQDGDVFCWNGEVFEGLDVDAYENDGAKLFQSIHAHSAMDDLPSLLGRIEGPYAFVYYHAESQKLYFARDPLGRRSLLIHKPSVFNPYFLLASVSVGDDQGYVMEELSTDGIFCLDVGQLCESKEITQHFDSSLTCIPRHIDQQILPFAKLGRVNATLPPDAPPLVSSLDFAIVPRDLAIAIDHLIDHLDKSVMLRVQNIPGRTSSERGRAQVAVLFSGGIDSTMLAFLAHRHVPLDEPIDLLNVAFQNPRKIQVQTDGNIGAIPKREKKRQLKAAEINGAVKESTSYMVPDRVTGLQEVEEFKRICPGRTWNFVEVDVPYEESQAARATVEAIMFPGRTVMDLSLAMALYFASKGVGRVRISAVPDDYQPYTSTARVLLNGLGSDELLGGYGRHRTAYATRGWQGVIDELQLELDRIPTRNLGRDDRVISSHGKETRHPFLSLTVVSFLAGLPVHLKLDPRLELGLGDKMLLRLAAQKVGLLEASVRKKKAMQFGSHSARMEAGEAEKRGDLMIRTVSEP